MADLTTFDAFGLTLPYFSAEYNRTRENERAVEIPLAVEWCHRAATREGVEIGNVLAHYGLRPDGWICLDLYEQGRDVINADVRDWDPGPLRAVLAISTFEHVGWDDGSDLDAAWPAIERTAAHLAPDGSMLVTLPLGQNTRLDGVLLDGGTSAASACTMVRSLDGFDTWEVTAEPECRPYLGNGRGAQSVWIGEFGVPLL